MRHPRSIWIAFGLCLVVVLAVLVWLSLMALRLDARQAEAIRLAALDENVRLVLWRMDSALTPMLMRESARPYFVYSPFYPPERAYTRMFQKLEQGEILMPSPLLNQTSSNILLHFQFAPNGQLSSPQVPTGNMRDLAETGYLESEQIMAAESRLKILRNLVSLPQLLVALPRQSSALPARTPVINPDTKAMYRKSKMMQSALNTNELRARQQNISQSQASQTVTVDLDAGTMTPLWIGQELLIVRRARVDGKTYVQGYWLDWRLLRTSLLAGVRDLLPEADLAPLADRRSPEPSRLLASLPVRLVPGAGPMPSGSSSWPVMITLSIAWTCVLLAAVVAAALLAGVISLSERRRSFVSAVTHELRTPLTTFRMYAEMLAEGMVSDEKRLLYLTTMRTEADRLSNLVENVLAYARLERGRGSTRTETLTLGELVERAEGQLLQRVRQVDMQLVVEGENPALSTAVRVNAATVEQILLNLVDNACKYAASASDRRIHVVARRNEQSGLLSVCDHGPGITRREARRLFQPFSRPTNANGSSMPGIGLGLVLSRRLARHIGGELSLAPEVDNGACFVLSLPLA